MRAINQESSFLVSHGVMVSPNNELAPTGISSNCFPGFSLGSTAAMGD